MGIVKGCSEQVQRTEHGCSDVSGYKHRKGFTQVFLVGEVNGPRDTEGQEELGSAGLLSGACNSCQLGVRSSELQPPQNLVTSAIAAASQGLHQQGASALKPDTLMGHTGVFTTKDSLHVPLC